MQQLKINDIIASYSKTENDLSNIDKLAIRFKHWKLEQTEEKSDFDFLIEWASLLGIEDYNLFLKLSDKLAEQGYYTRVYAPIAIEDFPYLALVNQFDVWMQKQKSITEKTHAEYLLEWVFQDKNACNKIANYDKFLALSGAIARHTHYQAALDVPIPQQQFEAERDKVLSQQQPFDDIFSKIIDLYSLGISQLIPYNNLNLDRTYRSLLNNNNATQVGAEFRLTDYPFSFFTQPTSTTSTKEEEHLKLSFRG